jgi:hypothetical protein
MDGPSISRVTKPQDSTKSPERGFLRIWRRERVQENPPGLTAGVRQLLLRCSTSGIHAVARPTPFEPSPRATFAPASCLRSVRNNFGQPNGWPAALSSEFQPIPKKTVGAPSGAMLFVTITKGIAAEAAPTVER